MNKIFESFKEINEFNLKGIESGTTDGMTPENYTEDVLSRISDILEISKYLESKDKDFKNLSQEIFNILPQSAKDEWNYSKWNYKK